MVDKEQYILITGANGYPGKYTFPEPLDNGYDLIAIKYPLFAFSAKGK
jgi:hypothetical protein